MTAGAPARLEAARYARRAHFRHDGSGPLGVRQPVLLLHGLGGDCGKPWAFLDGRPRLRRIAPDLRAHGVTSYIGPAEAFTPEQLAQIYDTNAIGTQRVNRAALPQLRKQGRGLVVWVSSSSARGGTPPYLSPYFAAKAAMDSLAVSYAGELAFAVLRRHFAVVLAHEPGTRLGEDIEERPFQPI